MKLLHLRSASLLGAVALAIVPFAIHVDAQGYTDGVSDNGGNDDFHGNNNGGYYNIDGGNNDISSDGSQDNSGFYDIEYISSGERENDDFSIYDEVDDSNYGDAKPCMSVHQIICETNAFKTYCDALTRSGVGDRIKNDIYSSTIFAPSNSAFQRFFQGREENSVEDFPIGVLEDLVLVHIHEREDIVNEFVSSDELKGRCGALLSMRNGDNTRTICQNSATKIFQKGPRNPSDDLPRVIAFGIEACDGVVHVVNRVILPSHFEAPTNSPVTHPTKSPTRSPMRNPVDGPTKNPTPSPTRHPVEGPTKTPTNPTAKPTFNADSAACAAHPQCVLQGVTGNCCPTDDDKTLSCCIDNAQPSPTKKPTPYPTPRFDDASCSAHPRCAGLEGDCCPTEDDERLECCDGPAPRPTPKPTYHVSSCSAYPKCREANLEGDCCPTDDGKRLDCCFGERPRDSCSAAPRCRHLGLEGDCCPTDNGLKLDCCFDRDPGTCESNPGCAAEGLEGECCPAANGKNLDCCYKEEHGFPIVEPGYCKHIPNFSCYKFGRPECCYKSSKICPKEPPECEVGFPIFGESYCTYAPNYGCYKNGWPECCSSGSNSCPIARPGCENESRSSTDSFCSEPPDFLCYEKGYPDCCLTRDGKTNGCPRDRPECNVGKRGCGQPDSLPSIYDFVCSQKNFEVLCYLIEEAELEDVLKDTGTYTIFAPTNQAFENYGEEIVSDLLDDPTGDLQALLKYHVSDIIYFEKNLFDDRKIDTLRGDTSDDFTTTKWEYGKLYQEGQGNDANDLPLVLVTDIVTCNGALHVVDNVILPRK